MIWIPTWKEHLRLAIYLAELLRFWFIFNLDDNSNKGFFLFFYCFWIVFLISLGGG